MCTPQPHGVAWVGRGESWAFLAPLEGQGPRAYGKHALDATSFWKQLANEFFLNPRESECPASNQGPTWAPSFSSWIESRS